MKFDELERKLREDLEKMTRHKDTRSLEHADKMLMCELALEHLEAYRDNVAELKKLIAAYNRMGKTTQRHRAQLRRRIVNYKRILTLVQSSILANSAREQKMREQKKKIRFQLTACSDSIRQFGDAMKGILFSLKKKKD